MDKNLAIGLFDSGIGGLSVLKQFLKFLPNERYVYLGDTARVPYGNKSEQTVIDYSKQCAEFLISKGVKLIVIACNTASAIALEAVRSITNVPVIGMIEPASKAAVINSQNGKIGVIGTRATISSNAYQNKINELAGNAKEFEIHSKACPLFVPLVEEGYANHEITKNVAREYLSGFSNNNVDTLVLGCTHYPLLKQTINEILPNTNLIDSGEHSAIKAIRVLANLGMLVDDSNYIEKTPKIDFYVTDIPATFYELTKVFLDFDVKEPKKIILD